MSNPTVTVRLEYSGMRLENTCALTDVPEVMARMCDRHGIEAVKISGPHTARGRVTLTRSRATFTVIHPKEESEK